MAEWFKALVLKTKVLKGTVGSNPTPTATMESLLGDSFVLLTSSSLIASFCVGVLEWDIKTLARKPYLERNY